jgi:hypothetical protein
VANIVISHHLLPTRRRYEEQDYHWSPADNYSDTHLSVSCVPTGGVHWVFSPTANSSFNYFWKSEHGLQKPVNTTQEAK